MVFYAQTDHGLLYKQKSYNKIKKDGLEQVLANCNCAAQIKYTVELFKIKTFCSFLHCSGYYMQISNYRHYGMWLKNGHMWHQFRTN